MKEFFARLNSTERRFVIAVMIVIFFIINLLFVWPRFKDWNEVKTRIENADKEMNKRKTVIAQSEALRPKLAELEKQDAYVPPEDQESEVKRTITTQGIQSGVNIFASTTLRQTATTNQFFSERAESVNLTADEPNLVDFLYKLGAGNSLIRVRDLTLNPEMPNRYKLQANLKLVASFQKKTAVRTAPATNAPAAKSVPAAKPAPAKTTPPPPAPTKTSTTPGRPPRTNTPTKK